MLWTKAKDDSPSIFTHCSSYYVRPSNCGRFSGFQDSGLIKHLHTLPCRRLTQYYMYTKCTSVSDHKTIMSQLSRLIYLRTIKLLRLKRAFKHSFHQFPRTAPVNDFIIVGLLEDVSSDLIQYLILKQLKT